MKTLITIISALMALTSCMPGQVIIPEGVTGTSEFTFNPECTSLSVVNTYKVVLDNDVPEGVAIMEADKAVLKHVKVKEDDGKVVFTIKGRRIINDLPIRVRMAPARFRNFSATGNCEIISNEPLLAKDMELSATGVSVIELEVLDAEEIEAEVLGTSTITLEGRAEKLEASATGVSIIEASLLECKDAEVNATGTSGIKVNVSGTLSGRCIGVSKVLYSGQPAKIELKSIGMSEVGPDPELR